MNGKDARRRPRVKRDTTPFESTPFVSVHIPCCPFCRSEEYKRAHTFSNGDGSRTQWVNCQQCRKRYRIVREPIPEPGTCITWPDTLSVEVDDEHRS